MKRIFLHIGSPKTGTTSIQHALERFSKAPVAAIDYPIIEKNGHKNIEIMFRDARRLNRVIQTRIRKKQISYNEYKKTFEQAFGIITRQSESILLSSEFLFGFSGTEVKELKHYLDCKGFEEYYILCYLRDPPSFYVSLVQQLAKASSKIVYPSAFKSNYIRRLEPWIGEFGNQSIHVAEFDRSGFPFGNVVNDLEKRINTFFDVDISLDSAADSNESLSVEQLVLLANYRKIILQGDDGFFDSKSSKLIRLFTELNQSNKAKKPILKSSQREVIISNHYHEIKELNSRFDVFNHIATEFPVPPSADIGGDPNGLEDVFQNFSTADYSALVSRILERLL